jgi:aspartyl protease family protein
MLRKLLLVGIVAGSSASIPIIYQSNPDAFHGALQSAMQGDEAPTRKMAAPAKVNVAKTVPPAQEALPGRKVRVSAGAGGHFVAEFKLNGRAVEAVIDTGATMVAINRSTARKIGIKLAASDFTHLVSTANGEARAAGVVIDNMRIGRIAIDNVQALVLEDQALDGALIGMNFLNQLRKFEARDGELLLVQ